MKTLNKTNAELTQAVENLNDYFNDREFILHWVDSLDSLFTDLVEGEEDKVALAYQMNDGTYRIQGNETSFFSPDELAQRVRDMTDGISLYKYSSNKPY